MIKKALNFLLLFLLVMNLGKAQSGDKISDLSTAQLESTIASLKSEEAKAVLLSEVIQSKREDLFNTCLRSPKVALELNQAIRNLPASSLKDQAVLYVLKAPSDVWGDAKAGELENPMAGVNRTALADICATTLSQHLTDEDFDLHHKAVLDRFSTQASRARIAEEFETKLKSQSTK